MRIAINGFGRIGRIFFRQVFDHPDIEVVAINDLGDLESLAYLLKYDSVYRTWNKEIKIDKAKNLLLVNERSIHFFQEKDPLKLPWGALAVDVVLESTGVFESYQQSKAHLEAGAKRVLLTAPAKDEDGDLGKTILVSINDEKLRSCQISSNASCTTNAISPIIAILSQNLGIKKAIVNTVHAYTSTQNIVDGPVKGGDFRRGRAGAFNIVPSTTGAALALTRVLPELEEKFDGIAIRVPVISGSIADITFVSKRPTSAEEVNQILIQASLLPQWNKLLKVTSDPIVSSDILGESYGAIVDLRFTKVIDGDLVKVLSWYDNEWGYAATLVHHLMKISEIF